MAISTVDDVANALSAAKHYRIIKNITAPKAAGSFQSSWLATGLPGAGAIPPAYTSGSGYTVDRTTAGALGQTNGSVQNWLMKMQLACTQIGTLYIADRLWSCAGMGFAAATYTVTTPGFLPARIIDNGAKCELWVEQFVAAGAASGTLICNYVDSSAANVSGTIAVVVSAPVIGQMQFVPMANNLGIKQLTSVVNSATWTSGSWGMTILEPITSVEITAVGIGKTLDWSALGLPKIKADACLFAYFLANGAAAPVAIGTLEIGDK